MRFQKLSFGSIRRFTTCHIWCTLFTVKSSGSLLICQDGKRRCQASKEDSSRNFNQNQPAGESL